MQRIPLKMTQAKFFDFDEKEDYYEEEEIKTPRKPGEAPDGGWGWMVVVGAIICSLFVVGVQSSFGVLEPRVAEYYDVPSSSSSLSNIQVLMEAFSLIAGPLASVLVRRFDCQKVTITGSVITFIALLVSTQMPEVGILPLTYGVLAGIGLGLVNLPAVIHVAVWFEHKRAFATGLALMGAGVGYFVFQSMVGHLLAEYDWRNALVIVSAISLHCCVGGALFRNLTHAKKKGMKRGVIQRGAIMKALIAEKERQRTISNGSLDNCIITRDNRLIKIDKIDLRNKSNSYINRLKETFGFSSRSLNRSKNSLVVPKVVVTDPIYRQRSSPRTSTKSIAPKLPSTPPTPKRDSGCGSLENSPKLLNNNLQQNFEVVPSDDPNDPWDKNAPLIVKLPPPEENSAANTNSPLHTLDTPGTSASRKPSVESVPLSNTASPMGSVRNLMYNNRRVRTVSNSSGKNSIYIPMQGGSVMTIPQTSVHSLEMSTIYEEEVTNCKLLRCLCKHLDLQLLRSHSFWLLLLSSFLTMFGYIIPLYHLPERGQELNMTPEKSKFLISILWVASMISRPILGWLADRPVINSVHMNNVMVTCAGILSLFTPYFHNDSWLGFYAGFFGIFTAGFFTLRSVIAVELYGKQQLASAFGLLLFFQGFAVLAGHGLAGVLNTQQAFMVVGGVMLSAGLLGFFIPRVWRWERQHEVDKFEVINIEEVDHEDQYTVEHCESTI
ncbi:MOT14-like protein [Mya arenaria]|uniref:MOT14-like protein n=1 Tax=Mya arenaria TaxID=6604 RepID=A0ABY7E4B5_MYAAR|nr:monocarboxylate transporter 5-like [Mya arenaria]XP_052804238.1 monocarboxylate transporter 5-like [Mya arenaria]WAR04848.1 MOT14-like protein [Mya arenaria]